MLPECEEWVEPSTNLQAGSRTPQTKLLYTIRHGCEAAREDHDDAERGNRLLESTGAGDG